MKIALLFAQKGDLMKIMKLTFSYFFSVLMITGIFNGCSSSGADDEDEPDCCADVVTLSGQVAVSSADAALSAAPPSLRAARKSSVRFQTTADTPLASATVTVVKMMADGTEEETDLTATTDESGNFTIGDVPVAEVGTGSSTDFYYEIRAESGDLTVIAPAAPEEDADVNISPETNIAAVMIQEVVDIPGTDEVPPPPADIINASRDLVTRNTQDLSTATTVPSVTDNEGTLAISNGMASAGGEAEQMYKAYQFESEQLDVENNGTATAPEAGAFLKRIAREGCGQDQDLNPLPQLAAEAMGQALLDGVTFTPADVVEAFNDVSESDVTADSSVSDFSDTLSSIDDLFGAGAEGTGEIGDSDLFALYVKGDLTGEVFTSDVDLKPDEAIAFIESLTQSEANLTVLRNQTPPVNQQICSAGSDMAEVIAQLLSNAGETDTGLEDPAIGDVQIYHDSGFGCNEGAGQGHFRGEVDVHLPADETQTVNSVVVTSSNATALGGDGSHTFSRQTGDTGSNHFVSQAGSEDANAVCVTLGQEVTYTITATLSGSATVTSTVTRTHPRVPEAQTFFGSTAMSGNQSTPSVTSDIRPVITWTSPEDALVDITDPPSGSTVKYAYEFSHMRIDGGAPISGSAEGCPTVSSEGQLYAVDNFIPTVDCDVETCATSQGTTPDQIVCRMNIQTFLVDENDGFLGQAAGEFSFFCVDTNADGDCGD